MARHFFEPAAFRVAQLPSNALSIGKLSKCIVQTDDVSVVLRGHSFGQAVLKRLRLPIAP